jgi:iron complex outermembrane receptor protein
MYIQGVRIENQQFGDEHALGLNDSELKVEVIKATSFCYMVPMLWCFNPEKLPCHTLKQTSVKDFSNTAGSLCFIYR